MIIMTIIVTQDGFRLWIWISFAMDLDLDMDLSLAMDLIGFWIQNSLWIWTSIWIHFYRWIQIQESKSRTALLNMLEVKNVSS